MIGKERQGHMDLLVLIQEDERACSMGTKAGTEVCAAKSECDARQKVGGCHIWVEGDGYTHSHLQPSWHTQHPHKAECLELA